MIRFSNARFWRRRLVGASLAAALTLAVPAASMAATAQVGFSPEGTARELVLDVIQSAHHDIRMLAYSFTAPDIAKALIAARKRGVDVRVVVDAKENQNRYSISALNALSNAGIPVRTDAHYQIQHDKVIVVDGATVETGSFNYSRAAERSNSENAIVIWNFPAVAGAYMKHWKSRWAVSQTYRPPY